MRRESRPKAKRALRPRATRPTPADPITTEIVLGAFETICYEMATHVSLTATTPILNQSNERNATILDGRAARRALGRHPAVHAVVDAAGALRGRVLRPDGLSTATCWSRTTRTTAAAPARLQHLRARLPRRGSSC
jgi:hypothetical protein